jgi:hypothetical protein
MQANISEVFNTYNVNILFTVAALPARVALGLPMPGGMGMPPQTNFNQPPAIGSGNSNAALLAMGGGDTKDQQASMKNAAPQLLKRFDSDAGGEED